MESSPDFYATMQQNFSVYYFWLELAEQGFEDGICNVQEVVAEIPDVHAEFIQRVKDEEDLSNYCQDFELKSFNQGRTDSFSSSNSPDLD